MSLEILSLSHRFGRHAALTDVTLRVRRGDCYGFLGHNGAGKTTTLRIALGLLRPQRGTVRVDGFDAARFPREARARMGGVIEAPAFHGHLGGRANLRLLAGLSGLDGPRGRAAVDRVLERVGLSAADADRPVRGWSQGMRQRLGLAQALLAEPPYLLLDEPFNGLDPEGLAEMRAQIAALARAGTTVLLSSHQLHEIEGLCNRVGILKGGVLLLEADTAALPALGVMRHAIVTDDDAAAEPVLRQRGLEPVRAADGTGPGIAVELGSTPARDVLRALLDSGRDVRAFVPRPPTLEDVYLEVTRGAVPEPAAAASDGARAGEAPAGVVAAAPEERRAPPQPVARVLRYEMARGRVRGLLLLATPAALAAVAIVLRWLRHLGHLREIGEQTLYSTTGVTAFEGVGVGLRAALPAVALLVAGHASQAIAGERTHGTLRGLLLRPVDRRSVVAGKLAAVVMRALFAFALVVTATLVTARACFPFADVVEVLPNGATFPLVTAAALAPELLRVLVLPILPLLAAAGLGLLLGAMLDGAVAALATTLAALLVLEIGRGVARALRVEGWLFTAHLPSPLQDASFVRYYLEVVQGASNAVAPALLPAIVAPVLWLLACALLTFWIFSRQQVP